MPKRTPLNAVHHRLGAKMVDFGGWEMPLHYGSQIEEHHRVRRDAGMFDVSHMLAVDVSGPGARDFLRRLLASDVARLAAAGAALYSCMLNPQGGVMDDLIVYRLGTGRYRLVVNAATADSDLEWMRGHAEPGVSVEPRRDLAMIAVQGPEARERVWQARPAWRAASQALAVFSAVELDRAFLARTGYTGEDGFELALPVQAAPALWADLMAAGVAPAGLGCRDTLRLEAGMNLNGQDMDPSVTPLECGLTWTVDRSPGREFIGRAALESALPRFRRLGLVLEGKGVLRSHQRIVTSAGGGEITSGSFSPTLNRSIALARLPLAAQAGQAVQVEIRDKMARAVTVQPPFVRRGKPLVGTWCPESLIG